MAHQIRISLPEPGKSDRTVSIPEHKGLCVIVNPSGGRKWAFRYRSSGIPRIIRIGDYDDMDETAAKGIWGAYRREVDEGGDPYSRLKQSRANKRREVARVKQEREVEAFTVAALVDNYTAWMKRQGKRSARDVERIIGKHLPADWRPRPVATIGKVQARGLYDDLTAKGNPRLPDLVAANLKAAWNHAERTRDDPIPNPWRVLKLNRTTRRTRTLDDDELKELVEHLESPDFGTPDLRDALWLALLTAARRGEIAAMNKAHINHRRRLWIIPAEAHKTGHKTREPYAIPLTARPLEIVKRRKGRPWLFPAPNDADNHLRGDRLSIWLAEVLAKANMEPFGWHDIRRSVATGMQALGIAPHIIERCLNHADTSSVAAHYQYHDYTKEAREAFNTWAMHIDAMRPSVQADNVTPIQPKAGGEYMGTVGQTAPGLPKKTP